VSFSFACVSLVGLIAVLSSTTGNAQEISGTSSKTLSEPAAAEVPTQPWEDGFVFRTGVGACFQQALSGRNGSGLIYQRFVFNPGIRLDLESGYEVFPWLRLGGEASFLYNSLDSVQYNNLILHGAGGFYQVPLMGTVRGKWPTEGPIRGHAVGGFGGVCDILTVGNEIARQVGRSSYYSYTWNYVCEVGAGVSFEIMPELDLELDYKLLCTPIPNIAESGGGESSFNHALEIGLSWKF